VLPDRDRPTPLQLSVLSAGVVALVLVLAHAASGCDDWTWHGKPWPLQACIDACAPHAVDRFDSGAHFASAVCECAEASR
jgi:hypothetical protein